MKHYDWVLFDADDTLFHFDAYRGLEQMFAAFGVVFTPADYEVYQALNKALWDDYQHGKVTAVEIKQRRFQRYADELQVMPETLNTAFMQAMAEVCTAIDGARALLDTLHGKSKLGIVTNGFVELQQERLQRAEFHHFFDVLVISEQIGIAKPDPGIFDYAFQLMGRPERSRVLMVGDNPLSDVLGGMNAGIDTCWLNLQNKPLPAGVTPTYQVSSLHELKNRITAVTL